MEKGLLVSTTPTLNTALDQRHALDQRSQTTTHLSSSSTDHITHHAPRTIEFIFCGPHSANMRHNIKSVHASTRTRHMSTLETMQRPNDNCQNELAPKLRSKTTAHIRKSCFSCSTKMHTAKTHSSRLNTNGTYSTHVNTQWPTCNCIHHSAQEAATIITASCITLDYRGMRNSHLTSVISAQHMPFPCSFTLDAHCHRLHVIRTARSERQAIHDQSLLKIENAECHNILGLATSPQ